MARSKNKSQVAPAEPAPEPKAPAVEGPAPPRRYLVKLKDVPSLVVEAADPDEAFARFKAHRSILSTDHEPDVSEVTDADPSGKPDGRP